MNNRVQPTAPADDRNGRIARRVNIPTDRPAARTHGWWAASVTITGRKRRRDHDNARTGAAYVTFYLYVPALLYR